jgi:hypothetical protein
MAVLIRHRPHGLGPAGYGRISPPLVEGVKRQPGFVLHVAFEDSQRFCVTEVLDSHDQHDAWFHRP